MIDFLSRFFRREEASKTLAKERLRLILMSDRVSLAPDIFDAMKGEMLDVLRRYLEIDERGMDVHFENAERQFALLATIPVREVRTHDAIALARRPAPRDVASAATVDAVAPVDAAQDRADAADGAVTADQTRPPQRRRRRRRPRAAVPPPSQPELPSDGAEGAPPPPG
jgi:cell division topological specificity factor